MSAVGCVSGRLTLVQKYSCTEDVSWHFSSFSLCTFDWFVRFTSSPPWRPQPQLLIRATATIETYLPIAIHATNRMSEERPPRAVFHATVATL